MDDNTLKFPEYFPDNCPPSDARQEELCVYRYCADSRVVVGDFLSYYQLDPVKYHGIVNAYGLSVIANEQDCIKGLKLPAIRKKYKHYARGITYIRTGVIKSTHSPILSSHYTWWLYEGVQPHTFFEMCS